MPAPLDGDEAAALATHALLIACAGAALFAIPLAIFPHTILGLIGIPQPDAMTGQDLRDRSA